MANSSRPRLYTRRTKWYNLAYLAFITLIWSTVVITPSPSVIGVILGSIIPVTGVAAIVGIILDKAWAKWAAIAAYGFLSFILTAGFVSSFLQPSLSSTLGEGGLRASRIMMILILAVTLLGMGSLMKKRPAAPV